jgi:hypothetical protein
MILAISPHGGCANLATDVFLPLAKQTCLCSYVNRQTRYRPESYGAFGCALPGPRDLFIKRLRTPLKQLLRAARSCLSLLKVRRYVPDDRLAVRMYFGTMDSSVGTGNTSA